MIFNLLEIIVAVLLIVVILLQMQGSGLSGAFGGSGEFYRSKRSMEKLLMWSTVVLAVFFGLLSIALLIVH
ncbi:MAG: preprotein translocase subunit SecG [Candidatus Staskawiczbacteria bacterium]|nr:preprotein translocase subunit SecG [Candidatus Staskawiczbacteria bacterium]